MVARFQSSVWSPSPRAKQEETLGEPLCWAFRSSYTGSKICQTRAAKKKLFTRLAGKFTSNHYPSLSYIFPLRIGIVHCHVPIAGGQTRYRTAIIVHFLLTAILYYDNAFCIDTCYTVFSFQVPLVIWRFPSSHGTLSHPAMFIGFPWNKPSSDCGIPMTTWNPPSVQAKELLLCLLTLAISREMGSGWETLCFISSGL